MHKEFVFKLQNDFAKVLFIYDKFLYSWKGRNRLLETSEPFS